MNNFRKLLLNGRTIHTLLKNGNAFTYSFFNFNYKLYRNIHHSPKLSAKLYMEHENNYAYRLMESKGYAIRLDVEKDGAALSKEQFDKLIHEKWSTKRSQYLCECFFKFGTFCSNEGLCISNPIFDEYIDHLTDNIKQLTDEELKSLFYYIKQWPETDTIRTRNFIEVWAALDDECLKRMTNWSFDEMLSYVSLFFMINVAKHSDFSIKSVQKLTSKAKQLTISQMVQTVFFIGVLRRAPFDMHNLEIQLEKIFSAFSIDDLAIMSMGYFKSKTPIRSIELLNKIIDKIIQESKNMHEVSLTALLKVIRYSMKFNGGDRIYRMLDTLSYEVPRLSVMCGVHIALVGTATLTLHSECLNAIANKVLDSINESRLKDLERLVLTFGTFNYIPKTKSSLFQTILNNLRSPDRHKEIDKHGKSFACCIAYLGLLGIYPADLMNKALSVQFLKNTYGKQCFTYGREILTIHNLSRIFHPDVAMNRLDEKTVIILSKRFTDYAPNEAYSKQFNMAEKMFLDIQNMLIEKRGGSQYVVADHILTHHQRSDLIMCNSYEGLPVPVENCFSRDTFGLIRKPPDDKIWIVLAILGRNITIRNYNTPTGAFAAKVKELKALGYHVSMVHWNIYSELRSKEEKGQYLDTLIEEAINSK